MARQSREHQPAREESGSRIRPRLCLEIADSVSMSSRDSARVPRRPWPRRVPTLVDRYVEGGSGLQRLRLWSVLWMHSRVQVQADRVAHCGAPMFGPTRPGSTLWPHARARTEADHRVRIAMSIGQREVVEHRGDVKQFGIGTQVVTPCQQRCPHIGAVAVHHQPVGRRFPAFLLRLAGDFESGSGIASRSKARAPRLAGQAAYGSGPGRCAAGRRSRWQIRATFRGGSSGPCCDGPIRGRRNPSMSRWWVPRRYKSYGQSGGERTTSQ